jgi:hypothetical protein
MSPCEQTDVAVHEAAHAVMFDALGESLEYVSVAPSALGNDALEGRTALAGDEHTLHTLLTVIPGALAGPAASVHICGESLESFAAGKFRRDEEQLISMFEQQGEEDFEEYKDAIHHTLNEWVRPWIIAHEEIILRFAEILQQNQTLEGDTLQQALSSAWAGVTKPPAADLTSEFASFWRGL